MPLVLGDDGRRLAKRHGDVTLGERLERGQSAEDVVGELGASIGLCPAGEPATPAELLEAFDPAAAAGPDAPLPASG